MNKKQELLNSINQMDLQIADLKKNKASAMLSLRKVELEEHTERFLQATAENPVNWKVVLKTTSDGELVPEQVEYLKKHVFAVNKIVAFNGTFPSSHQVSFQLQLINNDREKRTNQITKLLQVLPPMIEGLEPVKIHDQVKKHFKVIPVLDKNQGSDGTYSILVDENNEAYIYREYRTKPEMIKVKLSLKDALAYCAKKFYFFE